jgi:hypothetical protein
MLAPKLVESGVKIPNSKFGVYLSIFYMKVGG